MSAEIQLRDSLVNSILMTHVFQFHEKQVFQIPINSTVSPIHHLITIWCLILSCVYMWACLSLCLCPQRESTFVRKAIREKTSKVQCAVGWMYSSYAHTAQSDDTLMHMGVDEASIFRSFGVGDAGPNVRQVNSMLVIWMRRTANIFFSSTKRKGCSRW